MASVASPYGFRPVGTLTGPYNGQIRRYRISSASTNTIFQGDLVSYDATNAGCVVREAGTATSKPLGVFMGCEFTNPTTGQLLQSPFWPNTGATDAIAFVADNPFLVMQVQSAGSVAATNWNKNVAISTYVAGDTRFGISKVTVGSSPAVTGSLPLRIIGFVNGPDSAPGDLFTDLLVTFNIGSHVAGTTGIQVGQGHALLIGAGI